MLVKKSIFPPWSVFRSELKPTVIERYNFTKLSNWHRLNPEQRLDSSLLCMLQIHLACPGLSFLLMLQIFLSPYLVWLSPRSQALLTGKTCGNGCCNGTTINKEFPHSFPLILYPDYSGRLRLRSEDWREETPKPASLLICWPTCLRAIHDRCINHQVTVQHLHFWNKDIG